MRGWLIGGLVLVLLVLHQDYWQWDRNEILFGFLPYTLAWNIGLSVITAIVWLFVCTVLWPAEEGVMIDESESGALGEANR